MMPKSLTERACSWIVAKGGNWHQLFSRGVQPDDAAEKSLTNPYAQSVWVMAAINHVARPISAVPLKFSLGETEFEDAGLTAFWDAPAAGLDGFEEFVEAWVGWLKLKGEAFLIADDAWMLQVPGSVSRGKLILAPPSSMTHRVVNGQIVHWEYRDDNGTSHHILPDQVYHTKLWNPTSRYRGLGEMEAALIAAEADYLTGKYEATLARNSGDQGMVVSTDGGQPSKEQIEQITAQLRRKRQRLLRGEYTDMFLAGGLKVASPTVQGADASLQASRLSKRHEIFVAFGVPPSLADVKQSYSLGKDSDYRALITNTCFPTANKLARVITKLSRLLSGQMVEAYSDWDEHPVMQEVRRERIAAARQLWDMGTPLKLASDYLDMDLPRIPGDEISYLPFSVSPAGSAAPANDPAFSEPVDPVQEMMRTLRRGRDATPSRPPVCQCGCDLSDATLKAANPQWTKRMMQRRAAIRAFESRFGRILADARKETLGKLESRSTSHESRAVRAAAADFVFDLAKFADSFFKGMRSVSTQAVNDAGNSVWKELGKDDPWQAAPQSVLDFTGRRANKLAGIPDDIHAQIKDAIQQGFDEGWSTEKIAAAIRAEFNGIDKERAKTIAITETAAAYGFGEHASMQDAGISRRKWLTSGLPNVRATHLAADGQVRGINEPFNVGGTALMYPGDEAGPPEETINCHCVTVAVAGAQA